MQAIEHQMGEPIDVILRRLYVDDELSQEAIAERLGIGRQRVIDWMALWGIPTRDRRKAAVA